MSRFGIFRNRDDNQDKQNDGYEYYEDTHNEVGEYTARLREYQRTGTVPPPRHHQQHSSISDSAYRNFVVYKPQTAGDVQVLIDYLKKHESAIMNLESTDKESSQRVLDFVSGAIYALNGSINRISGNIFLLSPEGVGVTNTYETGNNK